MDKDEIAKELTDKFIDLLIEYRASLNCQEGVRVLIDIAVSMAMMNAPSKEIGVEFIMDEVAASMADVNEYISLKNKMKVKDDA